MKHNGEDFSRWGERTGGRGGLRGIGSQDYLLSTVEDEAICTLRPNPLSVRTDFLPSDVRCLFLERGRMENAACPSTFGHQVALCSMQSHTGLWSPLNPGLYQCCFSVQSWLYTSPASN